MKTFLKKDNLQLLNGGYLSDAAGNPVFNQQFVDTQKHAEYVVEFARLAKTKDFKGKKADSLVDLKKELAEMLDGSKIKEFVKKPEAVVRPIADKLKEEAMSFLNFYEQSDKTTKINNFLQQFLILSEFEEFGLFFDADIVKLNKIYTMQDVIDAVTETIDLV